MKWEKGDLRFEPGLLDSNITLAQAISNLEGNPLLVGHCYEDGA